MQRKKEKALQSPMLCLHLTNGRDVANRGSWPSTASPGLGIGRKGGAGDGLRSPISVLG